MNLTQAQVDEIHSRFDHESAVRDVHAINAVERAAPNGEGLLALVHVLNKDMNIAFDKIQMLEVSFSFDSEDHSPSRKDCEFPNQPIRGKLRPTNSPPPLGAPDCDALNADTRVIEAIRLPEIFPKRLEAVRRQWVGIAEQCFPWIESDVIQNESLLFGLAVSLGPFVGGPGDGGCQKPTCPGKAKPKSNAGP